MMIPGVYKFDITINKDVVERFNAWRHLLPHTKENAVINTVSRPFRNDTAMGSYYDEENNTIVVFEVGDPSYYLVLEEPIMRKDGIYADMVINSSHKIGILSVLNNLTYDGMNGHLKLLNIILGTDFATSDDNPVF